MAALLQAISPKKVQQAKKMRMCPPATLTGPTAPASPSCHSLSICLLPTCVLGFFWLFYFICLLTSFILQSSFQFLDPSGLLHPLHCFSIVRSQKLISLRVPPTWTVSTTARVWAGITPAQGTIPRLLQTTDCGGSIAVWSLAMLIVASQRKSLAVPGLNTL